MIKKIVDFFLFSSLFIAGCAVAMVFQTGYEFRNPPNEYCYYYFVFFSTITSYNFHWYYTNNQSADIYRSKWSSNHRMLHLGLFILGIIGSSIHFIHLIKYAPLLIPAIMLAFFYSISSMPTVQSFYINKIAGGKTFYLSLTWLYVTTVIPLLLSENPLTKREIYFILFRFFLIFIICLLFDNRDKERDQNKLIINWINYHDEKKINIIFYFSAICGIIATTLFISQKPIEANHLLLVLPFFILIACFPSCKKWSSDYLYYFFLDGLMAAPFISVFL